MAVLWKKKGKNGHVCTGISHSSSAENNGSSTNERCVEWTSYFFCLKAHHKSDSGLTCKFKQNPIDHHYAVVDISLVSRMIKLPVGKHHLPAEEKEKSLVSERLPR